ncbi:MAG: DUF898 domain-containing protein [Methylococcaceae bacterium]|nr:DUF898 domain-containing protein [Methylococcaceae bacterium]
MTDRQYQQFHFTGRGGEYFRIWIVNVCLSIVTLGIYSAWAKVRRNQYFYRHTLVAGASFDYHGDPKVILKGRAIAFLMFAAYSVVSQFNPAAGVAIFALIMLAMPWLLVRSLRFRLHNTSYRALRFAFHGETGQAYVNLLLWPLLSFLTLGLLWPMAQQRIARYTRDNSAYGDVSFRFEVGVGEYYRVYLMAILIVIANFAAALSVAILLADSGLMPAGVERTALIGAIAGLGMYVGIFVFVYPYVAARMQNLVWNNTSLADHRFVANVKASGLLVIMLGNLLLIVFTLGFYKPFADIRLARYRIEHLNLLAYDSLDQFVAGMQSRTSAAGEEMADMFDFDVAL